MKALSGIRWSVLDRSPVRQGERPGGALRGTVRFAREAEALGYHRFWVAEHHGVPGIAGAAPTVLAAAVAAATTRIRVGTGGVMLPNHVPLVVAEQFGVLEALHPGRIDAGVGRSVGFTEEVRRALGADRDAAADFGERVDELLAHLDGHAALPPLPSARPADGPLPVFVLATGAGADLAARRGLPLVIGSGRDPDTLAAAVDRYRAGFRPSPRAAAPYVVVAVNAAVAATGEEAELRQLPEAWSVARSRTTGAFAPLLPPAGVPLASATARELRHLEQARAAQLNGNAEQVGGRLAALAGRTGADEFLLTFATHDPDDRLDSYRRLASLAGLSGATTPRAMPSSTRS
ncbi:MsnO8 family LLM class oxidoreductase [Streptomyces sp. 549]|uniref:MsnO8 family LLM class oxidoreductase n=1 Tax=Streptomyces sp. 549 TaxID=3049076 RepID=UPI0024C44BB4|nr:MsnO8 family LLM class oxidoreductase [Streptomyces sp. 549]MDK1476816.1 MsnO8 family LLM class oxidoreductase [Streptomyces sp. 549]